MLKKGSVVKTIAGHDKDKFYVVLRVEGNRVFIADGKSRKLEKPKCKNVKHIRITQTALDMEIVKTDKRLRTELAAFAAGSSDDRQGRG